MTNAANNIDEALRLAEPLFESCKPLYGNKLVEAEERIVALLETATGTCSEAQMDALVSAFDRFGNRQFLAKDGPVRKWVARAHSPDFYLRALRSSSRWWTVQVAVGGALNAGVSVNRTVGELLQNQAVDPHSQGALSTGVSALLDDEKHPTTMRDIFATARNEGEARRLREACEHWVLNQTQDAIHALSRGFDRHDLDAHDGANRLIRFGYRLAQVAPDDLGLIQPLVVQSRSGSRLDAERLLDWGAASVSSSRERDALAAVKLPIAESVHVEHVALLRFGYLRKFLRTEGRSLEDDRELAALADRQQRWDGRRDEFLVRRAAQERKARTAAEGARSADGLDEPPRGAEDGPYGDEFRALVAASDHWFARLNRTSLDWERVDPDGVFGEFHTRGNTITLYPRMIQLLARDSRFLQGNRGRREIERDLLHIAELHEWVHAHMILGLDDGDATWDGFDQVSYVLHEALATSYTDAAIQRDGAKRSVQVTWQALRPMLPQEYLSWPTRRGPPTRAHLLSLRSVHGADPLLRSLNDVHCALRSMTGTLALRLGQDRYATFRSQMHRIGASPRDLARTLRTDWPEVVRLLDAVRTDLLSGINVVWLGEFARSCAGLPVGDGALRIRLDWIRDRAVEATRAAERDQKNGPALDLPDFDKVMTEIKATPDDLERFRGVKRRPR